MEKIRRYGDEDLDYLWYHPANFKKPKNERSLKKNLMWFLLGIFAALTIKETCNWGYIRGIEEANNSLFSTMREYYLQNPPEQEQPSYLKPEKLEKIWI